jgi:xanthine dehydrogenase accessory factor
MSEPLRCWIQAMMRALQREAVVVRIVLATVRGSAPREAGVGMLVTSSGSEGTIGGGQLEWEALAGSRTLLDETAEPARMQRVVLGADRGQCCGGVVEVWMERYTRADLRLLEAASWAAQRGAAVLVSSIRRWGIERCVVSDAGWSVATDQLLRIQRARAMPRVSRNADGETTLLERLDDALPPLWLYGAGHVGQALARILMELPLRLTWIDSRAEQFPSQVYDAVRILHSTDPVQSVAAAPAGSRFLVLTHSHPLDYSLCRAILGRSDVAWLGLIGSMSKAARFRARLARDGVGADAIARLVCPIGIGGISSKWPAAIAVGVAAQVMLDISAHGGEAAVVGEELTLEVPPAAAASVTSVREKSAGWDVACAAAACATCGPLVKATEVAIRRGRPRTN